MNRQIGDLNQGRQIVENLQTLLLLDAFDAFKIASWCKADVGSMPMHDRSSQCFIFEFQSL